jgi:soluble lytic murein transglycosylase-like protein
VELGEKYEDGESVTQDYHRALALYCEAARKGDADAFFQLGWIYLNGRGVPRDDANAVKWLRQAAAHGIPQAASLLSILPQASAAPPHGCEPSNNTAITWAKPPQAIRELADQTAQNVGVNPRLLLSVMAVESGFNPRAVSPKMAVGLMQLMPATASRYAVRDTLDERENIEGGATYLRDLLQMFDGNLTLALAAYNAGEGAVLSHGGVPPYRETINYIDAVKRLCGCD